MNIGHVRQNAEKWRGVGLKGGDAHQPFQGRAKPGAHSADKAIGLGCGDAGFLWLIADIHLHQQVGQAAGALGGMVYGIGQRQPVQTLYGIGQPHRLLGLIGLQPTDHMQSGAGQGEFFSRFLDPIFAKDRRAGV